MPILWNGATYHRSAMRRPLPCTGTSGGLWSVGIEVVRTHDLRGLRKAGGAGESPHCDITQVLGIYIYIYIYDICVYMILIYIYNHNIIYDYMIYVYIIFDMF